jgi:DNA-binding transcriptional LysR family regulator
MIDKLEMFIALANERHFGRAAESCGISQPSLSSAIRQLEDQLGVQLVWRGSRFQGLTPEGQRVLEWALRIVADARAMRDEMRAARSGLSGVLRIGVIPTALAMVAGLIAPFTERHPNVRIVILSRASTEILHQIDALELDAGISYLAGEPLGRVATVRLYDEEYRLLVPAGTPLADRAQVGWAEVAAQPLCLLTGDMQNRRIINGLMAAERHVAAPMIESNSVIALIGQVATGGWASVIPEKMASLVASNPALRSVPIRNAADADGGSIPVGLIAAHREPHTPVIAALLEQARRFGDDRA